VSAPGRTEVPRSILACRRGSSFWWSRWASLSLTGQFVLSYVPGANGHAASAHSIVSFDHQRVAAGEEHYQAGKRFEPEKPRPVLEPATFFEPRLLPLLEK
jgi:hypothetical protein